MNNKFTKELQKRLAYFVSAIILILITYSLILYSNTTMRNTITDLYSLLADIVTVITLGFLFIQVVSFLKDYNKKHARQSKENALKLSKFYIDSVLPNFSFLNSVLSKSDIRPELKKIQQQDLLSFDLSEYHNILDDDEIEKISKLYERITPDTLDKYAHLLIEEKYKLPINSENCVRKTIYMIADDTLNRMEYMSMAFNQNVADEKIVYQSLHQTFLRCVELLYFRIVQRNYSVTDKYYTNIIWLYREWKTRSKDIRKTERETMDKNIEHGIPLD